MKDQDPKSLEEALLSSARWNAITAFRGWSSEDFNARIQASIGVGAAVEMMLKYVVARDSPLHLMEVRPADVQTKIKHRNLLSRENYGPHLASVRSCSSEEAFHLAEMLGHKLLLVSEMKAAMNVRNGAVHLAALPDPEHLKDAVYSMIVAFERAATRFPTVSFDFQTQQAMTEFLEQYLGDHFEVATAKIAKSARGREKSETHGKREFVLKQRAFLDLEAEQIFGPEASGDWGYFFPHVRSHECYNCSQMAMVLCGAEGDFIVEVEPGEFERSDDVNNPDGIVLTNVSFACDWCGLTLYGRELVALSDKGNSWADALMTPKVMTVDAYTEEHEPYTLKILRRISSAG